MRSRLIHIGSIRDSNRSSDNPSIHDLITGLLLIYGVYLTQTILSPQK